jgi:hypothetical protein
MEKDLKQSREAIKVLYYVNESKTENGKLENLEKKTDFYTYVEYLFSLNSEIDDVEE